MADAHVWKNTSAYHFFEKRVGLITRENHPQWACLLPPSFLSIAIVSVPFIPYAQDVVRSGGSGKIVGADDAFVVIGKGDTSDLRKKAGGGCGLHPSFIEAEGLVPLYPSDGIVLQHKMNLEPIVTLIIQRKPRPSQNEGGVVFRRIDVAGQAASANLTVSEKIKADTEVVLQAICLGLCEAGQKNSAVISTSSFFMG